MATRFRRPDAREPGLNLDTLRMHRVPQELFTRLNVKSARILGEVTAKIQPVSQVESHCTEIASISRGSDGIGAIFTNTPSVIAVDAAVITYPIDRKGTYWVVFNCLSSGGIRDVETLESSDPGASDVKVWGMTGTGSAPTSPTELVVHVPRDGDFLILRSRLGLASGNLLAFVYTRRIG